MDITQTQTLPRPKAAKATVVDRKTAEEELTRALEAVGIELGEEDETLGLEDKAALREHTGRLVRAIERGILTVDDKDRFVLETGQGALTFRQPTGGTLMATDGKSDNANFRKTFSALAELTGRDVKTFAMMGAADIKRCDSIFALFFG